MPVIVNLETTDELKMLLTQNKGVVIIKFGATWCGPCKKIEPAFYNAVKLMPPNVQFVVNDIDETLNIYSFLKTKKMLNGIPAILAYYKGNNSYIPDDSIIGADLNQLNLFFDRCYSMAKQIADETAQENVE